MTPRTVSPLNAIAYGPAYAQTPVYAPPYDVISPSQLAALRAASPYNAVRLILGATPGDADWHAAAAYMLADWLRQGVLAHRETPAYTLYRQTFRAPDGQSAERVGLLGRVLLRPWGQGVYRHEHTRAKPRADRLKLLRATRTNLSPVFGLYRGLGAALADLLQGQGMPEVDVTDEDGVRHMTWALSDPAHVEQITQALDGQPLVIADGHHRYETALEYSQEQRPIGAAPGALPSDYVLMYLCAAEDPGLRILPAHRVVAADAGLPDRAALVRALSADFLMTPCPTVVTIEAAVRAAGALGQTLGCCLGELGNWLLTPRDPPAIHRRLVAELPVELAALDVMLLQRAILEPLLGITPEILQQSELVSYTIDGEAAGRAVARGEAHSAFILNPTPVDQVWQAALHGVTMPQKSTYFYPKLLTGLVMNPLERGAR